MVEKKIKKKHAVIATIFGCLEIFSALIVAMSSFVLRTKIELPVRMTPHWASIPFLLPGILGIATILNRKYCPMVTFIISNILCFIVNGVAVVYIGRGIGIYNTAVKKLDEVTNCKSNIREACVCNIDGKAVKFSGVRDCEVLRTVDITLWAILLFSVMLAILSIASSVLGCIAVLCTTRKEPRTVGFKQTMSAGTYPNQRFTQDSYPPVQTFTQLPATSLVGPRFATTATAPTTTIRMNELPASPQDSGYFWS